MREFRSKRCAIGDGYAVEFVFRPDEARLDALWSPDVPRGRPHLIPAYQRARHAFLGTVATHLGAAVAVMDI